MNVLRRMKNGVPRMVSQGLLLGALVAFSAQQVQAGIPFSVQFAGGDTVLMDIINESGAPITKVKVTIGDTRYNFDIGSSSIGGDATGTYDPSSGRDNEVEANVTGFAHLDTLWVDLEIDLNSTPYEAWHWWGPFYLPYTAYTPENNTTHFNTVLMNNGSAANATVTVYNAAGQSETLTIPDGYNYTYHSVSRPPTLSIRSIYGDGNGKFVPKTKAKVISSLGTISTYTDIDTRDVSIYNGDVVEITAPQYVYEDELGTILTDSGAPDAAQILAAKQRFEAVGISINNVLQTGDPTLYRFEANTLTENAQITVKWRQDFSLDVKSSFLNTHSPLKDDSEKSWAGPAHSEATGNPEPSVKNHWIAAGELVTATIDGQVVDYSHPGLEIRYIPSGYTATGAAGGNQTFAKEQSPPSRQQISQFTMTSPASITYNWQIQFGITMNADDVSRESAPLLCELSEDGTSVANKYYGSGTYWFNPGTKVRVLSKANDGTADNKALNGWVSGDGYYFESSGEVYTPDGSLFRGASSTADWLTNTVVDGTSYRGFEINKDRNGDLVTGLNRPVRVLWTYGNQALAVTVPIGQYVFQTPITVGGITYNGSTFRQAPDAVSLITVNGKNTSISPADMSIWDPVAGKLFPLVPGIFRATWTPTDDPDSVIDVLVTATFPSEVHYPHIADTPPVNLQPSSSDPKALSFVFKELKYTENEATVDGNNYFRASKEGRSVLLFSRIQQISRGQLAEYMEVRTVETANWKNRISDSQAAIIGRQIKDPALDLAKLDTGYVMFSNARYNPFVYDATKLNGLAVQSVYDMTALNSTAHKKIVTQRSNLPGPVIPVNLHPGASAEERIVMVWYDDPSANDNLLWPYAARTYTPRWPTTAAEGLGRIVIASQFGSESVDIDENDQMTAEAITNKVLNASGILVDNVTPAETTFNPARTQQAIIYNQPDRSAAGYNPNEEHALMAPSLRFAANSPRPDAAYALRFNDLNRTAKTAAYTSDPYVLVQYLDTADNLYKMKVYYVVTQDTDIDHYSFADSTLWAGPIVPPATTLRKEPYVLMEAGEPVIPFYPLGVVIGAVPTPETYGSNITSQLTYWEDHKGTSWSVSGGTNAWFTQFPYYPLSPDFWWPPEVVSGKIVVDADDTYRAAVPNVGDSLAFLPKNIKSLQALGTNVEVQVGIYAENQPTEILYGSKWPDVLPILKAGETLTFSGGEYRTDHPTSLQVNEQGELETVETPGLPAVLGFAVAEIAYDSANPTGTNSMLKTAWTARIAQVLEKRTAPLLMGKFPPALSPASGRTRISQGKYVFNELPASLQKRFRYDPIGGRIEMFGLVNDKDIAENTLTASPPAVYVLEPNIMTAADLAVLKKQDSSADWRAALDALYLATQNPGDIKDSEGASIEGEYLVGLEQMVVRNSITGLPELVPIEEGSTVTIPKREKQTPAELRAFGPGIALLPNSDFMDPLSTLPDVSYVTVTENNDPSLGGSPVTLHVIKVDRNERYRGAIKTVLSDNVFDENIVLRHTGDFGAHAEDLYVEWWYRPDDGSLNVPPPDLIPPGTANPWKIFPDTSGGQGKGLYEITLKGNPNAPEALLADTWWFARYRHKNDIVDGIKWNVEQSDGTDAVNFTWAGAGNSDPFHDYDLNGIPDFKAQLAMGWIKRVLDAVNPYEARIRDFEGDSPSTVSSMIQEFGARYEGPVALNPDKNVIENVGLIELYETILKRGRDLSIDLSRPVSTPAIANALELAATRISDFYTLLGNEAYTDALNPTIGFGSDSVEYGSLAPSVFTFQNQLSTPIEEELGLLRGLDDNFARPVYNRLFWNFTKGEGEAAYALNYNVTDINADGFIDEDDAMILYPQGHGDAWGHYLTAVRNQYDLFKHKYFNWVSRSEFYNLMDIVIKVDFLDERKFAQVAAAKAKAGAEIVDLTYREKYVMDPTAQWQGYTDSNPDRAWGVQGWARRAGQGAYFDWVTANALLPADHPNTTLEGIQKVDRASNGDIAVISANMNKIQWTFDQANKGYNPLGLDKDVMPFDVAPTEDASGYYPVETYFEIVYDRAIGALENTKATWDKANEANHMLRQVGNSEAEFRNSVYQEDLSFRNRLIEIFGRPYEGTIGSGKLYPAGYDGPDLALHMYVNVREINDQTVPGPTASWADFDENGKLTTSSDIYKAFNTDDQGTRLLSLDDEWKQLYAPSFGTDSTLDGGIPIQVTNGSYRVTYTSLTDPKVGLQGLTDLMPVTTAGYTFQAPDAWGSRLATGQLQTTLSEMIQQEAAIAIAIGEWDGLSGQIVRSLRLMDARILAGDDLQLSHETFSRIKLGIEGTLKGLEAASTLIQAIKATTLQILDASVEAFPHALPTAGMAFSPGDALAPGRAGVKFGQVGTFAGFTAADAILAATTTGFEIALSAAENELDLWEGREALKLQKKEWLEEIEGLIGDEPVKRIAIFKEIEALRQMSNHYRTLADEGSRLVDERAAFNKRVAAQTQLNRYQDMTFRVSRNHALQTYRQSFDLAARYVFLAARAYDYETNFDPSDPGSSQQIMAEIIKARGIGLMDDNGAHFGGGGLAEALAWLKTNYSVISSQIGVDNPQLETGKLSLRTELYRILPKGEEQPVGIDNFPSPGGDSDALWEETLNKAKVADLWDVPEFRQRCRAFAAESDEYGNHIPQPGLVFRFPSTIHAGKNFFGLPLSGGDHAYDSSIFANKIYAAGIWFSDYLSTDVLDDLPAAPRAYLFPAGLDIMSVPTSGNPDVVRTWNVVDQKIPVPIPALGSDLERSDWVPLFDSLSGQYGEVRRFSSMRGYHDEGDLVNYDELVTDTRLFGRSVWNSEWVLIIPGLTLNSDPDEGLKRFIEKVSDIKIIFQTYGISGN